MMTNKSQLNYVFRILRCWPFYFLLRYIKFNR